MQTIYILDSKMPIPTEKSQINTLEQILEGNIENINTSCTVSILSWANNEFEKLFKTINIKNKFSFDNILVAFFQSDLFGCPEGNFNFQKNLVSIKLRDYNTGKESNIQQVTVHELTHAATPPLSIVGLAITEGIACYMEVLYYKANSIPSKDNQKKDEGYTFAKNLIDSIILNIYDKNLDLFFEKIKKGNEEEFIKDIDKYLKSKNIPYNANELLKLSSILYYAKKLPKSPFEEYKANQEMEFLRNEILDCLDKNKTNDNLVIYEYCNTIKYICSLCNILRNNLNNNETFNATLDREIGTLIIQKGSVALLDNKEITNTIKNVFNITKTNITEFDKCIEKITFSSKNNADNSNTKK